MCIHQSHKRGFTLLEVMVSLGIFTMISMVVSSILIDSLRSNAIIWEQLQTQNDGRRVIQQVIDDTRRAEDSSLGAFPLQLADPYEIIFYANIDADSLRERVHYWLDGTSFKKGVLKPSGSPLAYNAIDEDVVVLANNVINEQQNDPIFTYFDETYTGSESPLTNPVILSDVRIVHVDLVLERDPTASPVPFHVESTVFIRNLKTN